MGILIHKFGCWFRYTLALIQCFKEIHWQPSTKTWFSNLVISWLDLQGRFLNNTVFFVFKCLDHPSSYFKSVWSNGKTLRLNYALFIVERRWMILSYLETWIGPWSYLVPLIFTNPKHQSPFIFANPKHQSPLVLNSKPQSPLIFANSKPQSPLIFTIPKHQSPFFFANPKHQSEC